MTLEEVEAAVEPNEHVLSDDEALKSLLGLVVEEYVLVELISDLTKEERYAIAKWASVCHIAAAEEDPPLPRPKPPEVLNKILLMPGRRVVLDKDGVGVVESYDWPPGVGGALAHKRPAVRLDGGRVVYPALREIAGVE